MPLPMCSTAPTNVIKHSGRTDVGVTDIWKASEGIHQLDNDYQVFGTLIIEPCSQVRLNDDVTIALREAGVLKVGAKDGGLVVIDAVDPALPWHVLYSVSSQARMELVNVTIRNGGSTGANGGGSIYMRGAAELLPTPVLLVDNVRIENSATYGIQVDSNGSFDAASKNLTVTGSKKSPIAMFAKALGSIPTGTYTGNTNDWLQVDGGGVGKETINADTTWRDRGIPYVPDLSGLRINSADSSPVLTLEPGVIVETREPTQTNILIGSSSTQESPSGALVALGTAAKPVTFRGRGNKNDWAGIYFRGAVDPRSQFDHVVIEDTGGDDSTIGLDCVEQNPNTVADEGSGAIRFFLAKTIAVNLRVDFLRNSTIRRSGSNGVLPDFNQGNAIDFCATNTFEDIDVCNQASFLLYDGTNLKCPNAPNPSPCVCE
jgi:hypothetical protein